MPANEWPADAFELRLETPELWRMAEELTVTQCALLLLGLDPQEHQFVENWEHSQTPPGYIAARDALLGALRRGSLNGKFIEQSSTCLDPDGMNPYQKPVPGSSDPERSKIEIESLITWLEKRGIRQSFFSPVQSSSEPYLDPKHERYANKLAAAVAAWKAVGTTATAKQSPKQQILKWLRENAAEFALSDEEGKPNERGIEEIAKVANWAPGGGAPKSNEE
tara:strand:+ start:1466 stop:2131 length:666 start_codon:yes stop_codon:yes gene_type:complete